MSSAKNKVKFLLTNGVYYDKVKGRSKIGVKKMASKSQAVRLLELAMELLTTGSISKEQFIEKYGKSVRTFQRDVKALRKYLAGNDTDKELESVGDTYRLTNRPENTKRFLSIPQLLLLTEILASSRVLAKEEFTQMMDTLLNMAMFQSLAQIKDTALRNALKNAFDSYKDNNHPLDFNPSEDTFEKLTTLYEATYGDKDHYSAIDVTYTNVYNRTSHKTLLPVSIVFDKYYLYLRAVEVMYRGYSFNTYRVDRIKHVRTSQERFDYSSPKSELAKMPFPSNAFSEHDYPEAIEFYCWPPAIEAALDNFGSAGYEAEIIERYDRYGRKVKSDDMVGKQGYVKIKIRDYPEGAKFWLMGQGTKVQVTSPESMVKEIKNELATAARMYDK